MAYHRLDTDQKRTLIGCGFAAAIAIAPFLALLLGVEIGIAVLIGALAVTAWAVLERIESADPQERRRLRALLAVNGVFLGLSIVALVLILLN